MFYGNKSSDMAHHYKLPYNTNVWEIPVPIVVDFDYSWLVFNAVIQLGGILLALSKFSMKSLILSISSTSYLFSFPVPLCFTLNCLPVFSFSSFVLFPLSLSLCFALTVFICWTLTSFFFLFCFPFCVALLFLPATSGSFLMFSLVFLFWFLTFAPFIVISIFFLLLTVPPVFFPNCR